MNTHTILAACKFALWCRQNEAPDYLAELAKLKVLQRDNSVPGFIRVNYYEQRMGTNAAWHTVWIDSCIISGMWEHNGLECELWSESSDASERHEEIGTGADGG